MNQARDNDISKWIILFILYFAPKWKIKRKKDIQSLMLHLNNDALSSNINGACVCHKSLNVLYNHKTLFTLYTNPLYSK